MPYRYSQPPLPGQARAVPPYGQGYPPPPGAPPYRRIDAMDVLEGILTDGFSISSLTRIARASGSNFWVGAAIGAGLVMLMHRPDVRATLNGVIGKGRKPRPEPAHAGQAAPAQPTTQAGTAPAADQQGA